MPNYLSILLLILSMLLLPVEKTCSQSRVHNYYSGLAAMELGKWEDAGRFFRDAIQDDIPPKLLYLKLGSIEEHLGNTNDALKAFLKAESYQKGIASYELAVHYTQKNKMDSALYYLDQHIRSPYRKNKAEIRTDEQLHELAKIKAWEEFWMTNRYAGSEMSMAETQYLIQQGQQEEALLIANNLLDRLKRNSEAYFHRGLIYYSLQDFDYAAEDFEDALKLKPKNDEYAYHLSLAWMQEQAFKKALKAIRSARELNSLNPDYLYTEAQILYKNYETEAALNTLNQYLAFFAHRSEAQVLKATILHDLDRISEAEAIVNELIAQGKACDACYYIRGNAHFKKGNFSAAQSDYSMSLDLNPKDPITFMNRGNTRIMLNDTTGACYDFEKAYRLGYKNAVLSIRDYCGD